jgi:hypothetical protein
MSDNNRKHKTTGMNSTKQDALKNLKEARQGKKRLEQAIEVYLSNNIRQK